MNRPIELRVFTLTRAHQVLLAVAVLTLSVACASADPPTKLDAKADKDGFVPLSDGKTLAGWRQYAKDEAPQGWSTWMEHWGCRTTARGASPWYARFGIGDDTTFAA